MRARGARRHRRRRRRRGVRAARGHRPRARRGRTAAGRAALCRPRREPAVRRREFGGAGPRSDDRAPRSASRCRRPDASPTCGAGETIAFGFDPQRAVCFARARRWPLTQPTDDGVRTRRVALVLLLAPALVWLVGLIVLPHLELAVLSLRARVAPRVYEFEPRPVPDVRRRAAVLAHVRAHGGDVDPGDGLHAGDRLSRRRGTSPRSRAAARKSMLFVLCLIPFWVSETVRTLGWMILLRESGVLPRLLVRARPDARRRSSCSTTTRRSSSVSSTRRCCSWWCRW